MPDELKRVYEKAGALDRFYEGHTPIDLYRGRPKGTEDIMQPTVLGFYRRATIDGQPPRPRNPDVLLQDQAGTSPQFKDAKREALVVDDKKGTITAAILRDADKYMVKGCRTMSGDFRGVSVFDRTNPRLSFDWFKIGKGTELDKALACTRDGPLPLESAEAVHYTIAPKDDMALSLFLQYLKAIANVAEKA